MQIVTGEFSRELNTILKPELQEKNMVDPINVKICIFFSRKANPLLDKVES
jgi:hypothetical protein